MCGLAAVVVAGEPSEPPLAGLAGADALHAEGLTGRGVTIAVVGSWTTPPPDVLVAEDGRTRLLARLDLGAADERERASGPGPDPGPAGHDALRAMLSNRRPAGTGFEGVAPDADLVLLGVPADGDARGSDLVAAVEWVVANRDQYGVRVLHLPLAAPRRPGRLEEPLAPAVVEAWRAGIVVVVAAGNAGPATSVAAPADVPQVITVGAATAGLEGSTVAAYSQGGPTPAGFVKPEILGPAGSAEVGTAPAAGSGVIALSSGTAVSSAVVAGVAALLLEADPWLTPDEVKLRLLVGARPLVAPDGRPVSPYRQGAGMVDARSTAVLPVWSGDLGGVALGMTWSEDPARRSVGSELAAYTWSESAGKEASGSQGDRAYTWSE